MDRRVRGRPGRLGRDLAAWRRASRSRRRTVSGAPAAGSGRAGRGGAGAGGRPGTPGRPGRTAAGSCPAAAAGPRSGGAAPRSPRPCPGRSRAAAAVTRTRPSHSDRTAGAARPTIMPQQARPAGRNQPPPPPETRTWQTPAATALTWADDVFGTHSCCHALWQRRNQTLPQLLDAWRNSPYRDAAFRNYPTAAALASACPARPIATAGILPSPQSPVARPEAHTRTQPGDMPPGRAGRTPTLHSGHRPQARAPSGLVAASGAGRCRRYAGTPRRPHTRTWRAFVAGRAWRSRRGSRKAA